MSDALQARRRVARGGVRKAPSRIRLEGNARVQPHIQQRRPQELVKPGAELRAGRRARALPIEDRRKTQHEQDCLEQSGSNVPHATISRLLQAAPPKRGPLSPDTAAARNTDGPQGPRRCAAGAEPRIRRSMPAAHGQRHSSAVAKARAEPYMYRPANASNNTPSARLPSPPEGPRLGLHPGCSRRYLPSRGAASTRPPSRGAHAPPYIRLSVRRRSSVHGRKKTRCKSTCTGRR